MTGFIHPKVGDTRNIAMGYTMTAVLCAIHPKGANSRMARFTDAFDDVRSSYHPDGEALPTLESESDILDGYSAAVARLWDVSERAEMSMELSTPSLGMLMERDVVDAAIASISEDVEEIVGHWGKCWAERRFGGRDEVMRLASVDDDEFHDEIQEAVLDVLSRLFKNQERLYAGPAGALAMHRISRNGWYAQSALSLAAIIGVDVEVPETLDGRYLSWLPE